MRLKLDENLSRHLKPVLVALGYDAVTAGDQNLLGRPDTAVVSAAASEGRLLLTLDLHFGDLRKFAAGNEEAH